MRKLEQSVRVAQGVLASEVAALVALVDELPPPARIVLAELLSRRLVARAQAPAYAGALDLRRCTPDQMLDAWQAARGLKAEAHLLGRIVRRRATRRAAL